MYSEDTGGKALIASKSPWGALLGGGIGWAVAYYGLQLDPVACNTLAGGAVLLGGYAMRYITSEPIVGIFKKPQ